MNEQQRAAMQMALEALEKIYIAPEHEEYIRVWWPACEDSITALREALSAFSTETCGASAQPQEPSPEAQVAHLHDVITNLKDDIEFFEWKAAQPQGEWVDLTDDEMQDCHCLNGTAYPFALAIIAKFKEKNTPPVVPQGEPVAWDVFFVRRGSTTTDRLRVSKREDAEREVDAKLIVAIRPVYTAPPSSPNLNCKSVQARLATLWGYVKAQPKGEWVDLTDDELLEIAEIDGADDWFFKVMVSVIAKFKEKNTTPVVPQGEPVSLPCCGYKNPEAIKWNQFNGVVQCHNCGQVYSTTPPSVAAAIEATKEKAAKLCEELWANDKHNAVSGADICAAAIRSMK